METSSITKIEELLRVGNFETARRYCLKELAQNGDSTRVLILLHSAYLGLSDVAARQETLARIVPQNDEELFETTLLKAENANRLARDEGGYYRISPEAKAGLTNDEYNSKYQKIAAELWQELEQLATTEARREVVATAKAAFAPKSALERASARVGAAVVASGGPGKLVGTLRFADGAPVSNAPVTLGLAMEVQKFDLSTVMVPHLGIDPVIGAQGSLQTRTDAQGRFVFEEVPAGCHEFLAVSLDPEVFDIVTRFVAQGIKVVTGKETVLDVVVDEWQSVPSYEVASPFAEQLVRAGVSYQRVHEEKLHNPFYFQFARQDIRFALPPGVSSNPEKLLLLSSVSDEPQPFQIIGSELVFFSDLPEVSDRVFALYMTEAKAESFAKTPDLAPVVDKDGTAVIDTGRASFLIPFGEGTDSLPPLLAVRGEDGKWRGHSRFKLPAGVSILARKTVVTVRGPLVIEWSTTYELSNGCRHEFHFTAHRDEPYLLAHEVSADIDGAAFEFSLSEFVGGRGYLHWCSEGGGALHWSSLTPEERELARLQESVAWWVPPGCFGYAMTPDSLDEKDYIAVFTIRRGEWIDREFERLSNGPIDENGKENRELDWPFPEMVGSTISMITAHTTASANGDAADAFFKFGFFNGERHWGLLVSTLERNDPKIKELASVQHKNSSPRLQAFKDWHLDEQDCVSRPCVVVQREKLRELRKKKNSPTFSKLWESMSKDKMGRGVDAFLFAMDGGDPVAIWRKKRELVLEAPIRARMVLFGRDQGDLYSPVGGRWISIFMENYDLIAASGAFTEEEERSVRAYFILMAHMFMEPDFMNWKNNSRNANFESDRTEIIGAIGLAFRNHPSSGKFLSHVMELMERSLNTYCTPGSGKWYENPACYYFAALGPRVNLAFHLAEHGLFDPTRIERLKDCLRWGVLLITPNFPHEYELLYNGCNLEEYLAAGKVRRVPPIGDHARLGTWIPEQYAMMAKLYRAKDPEFANLLLWAYQAGGSDGGYFSNKPALFASLEESDLAPAPQQELASRRLEGFGSVFRGNFNTEKEFYLLLKQGPGGYRYHRTEGSIVLFADGKPLIYDGGEAGETWRHTTLSFYDVHMPMACGHVERFHSFGGLDFCQGVHPVIIKPGEPIQLNDDCHHKCVPVAWSRYREPNPANVRSVLWVKDEYIILHDDLQIDSSIPSFWHAQVVAESETGNAREGFRFKGRFGTDLQVLLPDQNFTAESCERLSPLEYPAEKKERFGMRHVQLTGDKADHYLAVLRPLSAGKTPVQASELRAKGKTVGVKVKGEGIDDVIFLSREPQSVTENGVRFEGRYGMVIHRAAGTQITLLAGSAIESDGIRVESSGPAVFVTMGATATEIVAEGEGSVEVTWQGKRHVLKVAGRVTATLPA